MLYTDLASQGYLDKTYGVVSNYANSGCDNFHLFSSEAMLIAGWTLWPQYNVFFKDCELEPGLIVRYPDRVAGGISQDEMIGASTLSSEAAQRIYNYGEKHWWYFNPDKTKFSLANWYGRFIDFKPYIKLRAGHRLNIFDKIGWSMMTMLSPLSSEGNTSGKILQWTQFRYMQGNNFICDLAIKFWKWRMTREYPGGLKQLLQIYFGPNHPLVKYAQTSF